MIKQTFLIGLIAATTAISAQKDSTKTFVKNIFTSTQVVNAQTTEVLPKKSWEFKIQHRFGKIGLDSSLVQDFLGMDHTANIRIAFGYSFSDRFYMAVGRTKVLKTYDFEGKYLLMKQTKEQKFPLSIALYANAAIRTERFPNIPDSAYFGDWSTDFYYKPSHRLAYNTQIIFSSKINDAISLQLTPILIYENLVGPDLENHTMALSFSGRFKTGLNSSILFEYGHVLNIRTNGFVNPASLAYEIGTSGHAFSFFITSSQSILEQRIYTNSSYDYGNAEFILGFSIKRNFWRK